MKYVSYKARGAYQRTECHEGNMPILKIGNGTLYAGGWTRGAKIKRNMAIVDLTGTLGMGTLDIEPLNRLAETAFGNLLRSLGLHTPMLNFYIKDYEVPDRKIGLPQWVAFARDVENYLETGRDVLIACTGGHGRTGMVASIVAYLIRPELVRANPVSWIRKTVCEECVETLEQIDYVFDMLGLKQPAGILPHSYGGARIYDHTSAEVDEYSGAVGGVWDRWWDDFENGRLQCQ